MDEQPYVPRAHAASTRVSAVCSSCTERLKLTKALETDSVIHDLKCL